MRYFTYKAPNVIQDGIIEYITLSEEELRKEHYPIWLAKLTEKFGSEYVDCNLAFEDFLFEWIHISKATEST